MVKLSIEKSKISELPVSTFDGEIVVVDTVESLSESLNVLSQENIVGVDTETRPSFKKGVVYEVSLLQVSTKNICYLIRLNKVGFPENLIRFLEDDSIIKVGLSLNDDIRRLHDVMNFKPTGFLDLQQYVKAFGIQDNGLQRIYAIIFGERISKGQQLTNWEAESLTPRQQLYAATDAWACLKIYSILRGNKFDPNESNYVINEEITEENEI